MILSWTQLWRACGVGARTHFLLESIGRTPTGTQRHQLAFTLCQRTFHAVSGASLLFRPGRKNKKKGWSLIDKTVSHTAHDVGKNLDYAGAVVCGSTLLRCGVGDRCCARSEGERHSHRTGPVEEQCGRRRRHCTCRRLAGDGFSLWAQGVPGVCILLPQVPLCDVVRTVGVAELLCSLCCCFCVFFVT